MATKVDANPLQSGGTIDLTDPVGAGKTLALMVVGFALFFTAMAFGQDGAQFLVQKVTGLFGISTQSSGQTIEVV